MPDPAWRFAASQTQPRIAVSFRHPADIGGMSLREPPMFGKGASGAARRP
jgi:hypothetical protein